VPRDISASNQTASSASTIIPVLFVKLAFDSGDVFAHSTLGSITWGGDTYLGVGLLGNISGVEEDSTLSRSSVTLSLTAIPLEMTSVLLNEQYQGRRATISLGYLNETTRVLVADPFVIFKGRMDTPNISQGQTYTIELNVESRFAAWDRALTRRYNNSDQQSRYSGDKGLEFVEQSTEKQIVWGQKSS
jgi:hypothetical protein